jgi:hypothetical protein
LLASTASLQKLAPRERSEWAITDCFIQTTEINSFAIGNDDEFEIVKAG